jgi:hypothetical protein
MVRNLAGASGTVRASKPRCGQWLACRLGALGRRDCAQTWGGTVGPLRPMQRGWAEEIHGYHGGHTCVVGGCTCCRVFRCAGLGCETRIEIGNQVQRMIYSDGRTEIPIGTRDSSISRSYASRRSRSYFTEGDPSPTVAEVDVRSCILRPLSTRSWTDQGSV